MKKLVFLIFIISLCLGCKKIEILDLNGDKKEDKIEFKLDEGRNMYTLMVNDSMINGEGVNISENYNIIDIDAFDNYKEICIEEAGTDENRKIITLYWYDGKEIQLVGMLQGSMSTIVVDGSGIILAKTKSQILQDWTFNDPYFLSDRRTLIRQPIDYYETNYPLTVKNSLKLFTLPDEDSETVFTLKKGEDVRIIATDDNMWCLVKKENGEKGWFGVRNFDAVIGTNNRASFYFKGLNIDE